MRKGELDVKLAGATSGRCAAATGSIGGGGGVPAPAAEPGGHRVDRTLVSLRRLALPSPSTGDRLALRCAACRHRGPQNRAVERRGTNDWWQTTQRIVISSTLQR